MTAHFDESITNGTLAMSGSAASRSRKRVIAASPSSIASSMLMSSICGAVRRPAGGRPRPPRRTCPRRMSWANCASPVTLVRSPTFTKSESGADVERLQAGQPGATARRGDLARRQAARRAAAMAADVVGRRAAAAADQVERGPSSASSAEHARCLGRLLVVAAERVGQAGVGVGAETGRSAMRRQLLRRTAAACRAPSAQFRPTASGRAWRIAVPERADGLAATASARRRR